MRFRMDADGYSHFYELNDYEAEVLKPVFTRALLEAQRNISKFEGIRECGDFGTKQSNSLEMWEERRRVLSDFLEMIGYRKD